MSIINNNIPNSKSIFHFYKNGVKMVSNTLIEDLKLDHVRKNLNLTSFELFQLNGVFIPISDEHKYTLKG